MLKLTDEQKMSWGKREKAIRNQTRPKCHEELMAFYEGMRIRKDAIGATNKDVDALLAAADKEMAV